MLTDGLGIFHIWLADRGEFGVVIAGDTGVINEELDSFWFFLAEFVVYALDIVFITGIELGLLVISA